MIEGFTVAAIIELVGIGAIFLVNLFQSFKMDHFKSQCCGSFIEFDGFNSDKEKNDS
jgi:hypothetical protein